MKLLIRLAVVFVICATCPIWAQEPRAAYHVAERYSIPGDGGWDYISVDSSARRLYVSDGTELEVLDADSGKVVGQIVDSPGVHGAVIAPELKRGFTSNGRDKSVTIFDTDTLELIERVPLEGGTDAILCDPYTKRVFPMNEKITEFDAQTGEIVGNVDLGDDPEAAVSDGYGLPPEGVEFPPPAPSPDQ